MPTWFAKFFCSVITVRSLHYCCYKCLTCLLSKLDCSWLTSLINTWMCRWSTVKPALVDNHKLCLCYKVESFFCIRHFSCNALSYCLLDIYTFRWCNHSVYHFSFSYVRCPTIPCIHLAIVGKVIQCTHSMLSTNTLLHCVLYNSLLLVKVKPKDLIFKSR